MKIRSLTIVTVTTTPYLSMHDYMDPFGDTNTCSSFFKKKIPKKKINAIHPKWWAT